MESQPKKRKKSVMKLLRKEANTLISGYKLKISIICYIN